MTLEDSAVLTASVLVNDTDTDNDSLSVSAGNPTAGNGTVVNHNDGTFTYTPSADFNGTDSFDYTVSDGNGGTDVGTVMVTVDSVNDGPVGNADAFTAGFATAPFCWPE